MRHFVLIFLLGFSYLSIAQTEPATYDEMLKEYYHNTVPLMQPGELYKRMLAGETVHLLDTRESSEYEVSALKGAVNVGYLFFSKNKVEQVNKSDLVVVYCTIGARSESVGEKLQKAGFKNVYNLYGGIIYWKNQGYPVYHNGAETENVHVYGKKWGVWLTNGKAKY